MYSFEGVAPPPGCHSGFSMLDPRGKVMNEVEGHSRIEANLDETATYCSQADLSGPH